MESQSLTIPVIETITHVVQKDVFRSKKYRLALNLLMWSVVCWRSIPDVADVLSKCMKRHKEGNRIFVARLLLFLWDFTYMGGIFFLRRWCLIVLMWRNHRVTGVEKKLLSQ